MAGNYYPYSKVFGIGFFLDIGNFQKKTDTKYLPKENK
jgi:hypothetical protein